MLGDAALDDAAKRLDEAEETRVPIPQLSLQYPEMTIDDAYSVQRRWMAMKLAEGRQLRGQKIGLTSRAMQQAVNITEPDYGAIYDDMFFGDASEIPLARFIGPRIEVELAFVLGSHLAGPGCTVFDVLRATEYVTPALELLDARVQMVDPDTGHTRTIVDTIADNAADAGVVLGGRAVRPFDVGKWFALIVDLDLESRQHAQGHGKHLGGFDHRSSKAHAALQIQQGRAVKSNTDRLRI